MVKVPEIGELAPASPWPLYHWPARLESRFAVCWLRGTPAFAARDPGPLESRKEYGSKPASTAKTAEKVPPIGSGPLIPIVEALNPVGARLHRDDLVVFSIPNEAPRALRESHEAARLSHPP